METFVVAYSIVWLALVLYVARLGMRQRQLLQTAHFLQSQIETTKLVVVEQRSEIAA